MNRTAAITTPKSIVRILATVIAMLALVGLATACEPPGCAKDCVTSVSVNPGTTSTAVVTTDKAKVNVTIYWDAQRLNPVVSKYSNTFQTNHVLSHGPITPDRNYWYTVTATDEAGKVYKENGSFRSMKRTVSVKLTRIKLVDDSDSVGTGELTFSMKAVDKDFGLVYSNDDMGSGTDKTGLTITKSVDNTAPGSFNIAVQGVDDDCEGIGSLCSGGTNFGYGSGSSDDADWATATTAMIVAPGTNGSGSWSASTTSHALKFQVYGTWSVNYTA